MSNIISYVDIIEVMTSIAKRHYQVNSFFLGKDYELENNGDLIYPVFQIYPEFAKMPINDYKEYKTLEVTLNCKVIDLTTNNDSNVKDVHSDTLRIAQDIVNELNAHPFYVRSNVSLMEDIAFEAIEHFEDDITAGWKFHLKLKVINANTFCGMPIEQLPGYSANGPTSSGNYVYVDWRGPTGPQGATGPTLGLPDSLAINNSTGEQSIISNNANGGLDILNNGVVAYYNNYIGGNGLVGINGNRTRLTHTTAVELECSNTTITMGSSFVQMLYNDGVSSLTIVDATSNEAHISYSNLVTGLVSSISSNSSGNEITSPIKNLLLGPINQFDSPSNNFPQEVANRLTYLDASKNLKTLSLGNGLTMSGGTISIIVAAPQGLGSVLNVDNIFSEGLIIVSTDGTTFLRVNNDRIQLDIVDFNGNSIHGYEANLALGAQLHSQNGVINAYSASNTLQHNIKNTFDAPNNNFPQEVANRLTYLDASKNLKTLSLGNGLTMSGGTLSTTATTTLSTLQQVLLNGNNAGTYSVNMNSNKITNLATGSTALDAVNLGQLNTAIASIKKIIIVVTQSATPATNINNIDIVKITGLAQAVTSMSTNLTGTPYDGQMIMWQITDNGTGRAITWGTSFTSTSTATLPLTTTATILLRVLTQYNVVTSKHECIA